MKKPLIILTGPTAVGKTELSIRIAKALDGEIISADSMQVYKHMNIGTAKIKKQDMDGVKHFLVDEYEPDEEFNIVEFQRRAKEAIDEITSRNHVPIIVGGTGFYIQSVVYDIDFNKEASGDGEYRKELEKMAGEGRIEELHSMLFKVDEKSANTIHKNNVRRVIRALEFYHDTGLKISEHNEEQRENESPYDFIYFVLNDERKRLYERINKRVDLMMEEGLLNEVKFLKEKGYDKSLVSMQGIGYKELLDFLDGRCTLERAVELIKQDTRHFAKRQITWFKREKSVEWINVNEFGHDIDKIQQYVLSEIESRLKLKSKAVI